MPRNALRRFARGGAALLAAAVLTSGTPAAQSADAREFDAILDQYRGGDPDAALQRLLAWDVARVRRLPTADEDDDRIRAAAAALLHAEAAVRLRDHLSGAHLRASARLLSRVVCPGAADRGDDALVRLCRGWHAVFAPAVRGDLPAAAERIAASLPPEPALIIATGIYHESQMGPEIDTGGLANHGVAIDSLGGAVVSRHGRFSFRSSGRAMDAYRRALALEPRAHEARVRLGRVLWLLDKVDDARGELERAQREAAQDGDRPAAYLAGLFLGRLHEDAGRPEAALEAYERAVAAWPEAPAARLAAARLLWAAGGIEEGAAMVKALWQQSSSSAVDPWSEYELGSGYSRRAEQLAALRVHVRR